MKRILYTLLACFFCFIATAQTNIAKLTDAEIDASFDEIKKNFHESPEEWIFTKVIASEGHNADELFVCAQEAVISQFSSCNDVIQSSDKDSKTIIGKGYVTSDVRTLNSFIIALYRPILNIKIETKENRYKIMLSVKEVQVQCGGSVDANMFGTATIPISNYFPYDRNFNKKMRPVCWDLLNFIYLTSNKTITDIEKRISEKITNNDNW